MSLPYLYSCAMTSDVTTAQFLTIFGNVLATRPPHLLQLPDKWFPVGMGFRGAVTWAHICGYSSSSWEAHEKWCYGAWRCPPVHWGSMPRTMVIICNANRSLWLLFKCGHWICKNQSHGAGRTLQRMEISVAKLCSVAKNTTDIIRHLKLHNVSHIHSQIQKCILILI